MSSGRCTRGTRTGNHKIGMVGRKTFRQGKPGYGQFRETERLPAGRAIEVDMHIIGIAAGAIFRTEGKFGAAAFVVDLMNQAMLLKCFQGSIERGAV